jgi:inner membrane protein
MEALANVTVIWFVIGFVLFMLEFIAPGFILFFFGVGAWIVAVITLVVDISLTMQLALFLGASVLTVLLFRKWVKQKLGGDSENKRPLEDEFVGRIALAETVIGADRNGKVAFKGTSWDASSDDEIAAGEQVTITGYHSILLKVKSNKKI